MSEKVIIDAQVLFYFHYDYKKTPEILQQLKTDVIQGKKTAIIPTIAIAELLWKLRKAGKVHALKKAISRWEASENVIIDDFDLTILKMMLNNKESHELHDEIIAMTCKKYDTDVVYSKDLKIKDVFDLELRSW